MASNKYTKENGYVPLKGKEKGLGYKNLNYKSKKKSFLSDYASSIKKGVSGAAKIVGKASMAAGKYGRDTADNMFFGGKKGLKDLGKGDIKKMPVYKKGGKVKKTGPAIVHKGERVLTKKQAKKFNQKRFDKMKTKVFGLNK